MKSKIFFFTCLSFFLFTIEINGQALPDTISFYSQGDQLKGQFYPSSLPNSPSLIFAQGFLETGDWLNIGTELSGNGINVFLFDFRGCFGSEGKFSLMNSQEDLHAAIQVIASETFQNKYNTDTSKLIIGGYSLGASMCLTYASHHPEIKNLLSIAGADFGRLGDELKNDTYMATMYSAIFEEVGGKNGPVNFKYINPLQELYDHQDYFQVSKQVENLSSINTLLIAGINDQTISHKTQTIPLYQNLKTISEDKVHLISYPTGHSFQDVRNELTRDIIQWIKQDK